MALDPSAMAGTMLARAISRNLVDQPPHFGLSRTYAVIAQGIAETLIDEESTVLTVNYGPGQPANPIGIATATGLDGLDAERYWPLIQNTCGFFGPFSDPFFYGLGGLVQQFTPLIQLLDVLVPIGTGTGVLAPGGILLDPDLCYEKILDAARAEEIMVVVLGVHTNDPLGTVTDPITQQPLAVGDPFSQSEILMRACAAQFSSELLFGTKSAIPVVGPFFPPPVPPVVAVTVTTRLL